MLASVQSPISLNFGSLGQVFVGHLNAFLVTLTKPASLRRFSWLTPSSKGRPRAKAPLAVSSSHRWRGESGLRVPSSDLAGNTGSMTSTQPPGSKLLDVVSGEHSLELWNGILVALADQLIPVCYAADHETDEYVVEGLSPGPFLLGVVDLKGAVRRDARISSADYLASQDFMLTNLAGSEQYRCQRPWSFSSFRVENWTDHSYLSMRMFISCIANVSSSKPFSKHFAYQTRLPKFPCQFRRQGPSLLCRRWARNIACHRTSREVGGSGGLWRRQLRISRKTRDEFT